MTSRRCRTRDRVAGTRWAKVDTGYLRNPKVATLTLRATMLHLASILYSVDQTTDGVITPGALTVIAAEARVGSPRVVKSLVSELTKAALWDRNGDGWHLHDFAAMNGQAMRTAVDAERAQWRQRQARHRGVTP